MSLFIFVQQYMKHIFKNLLLIYFALFLVQLNTGVLYQVISKNKIEKSTFNESEESEKEDNGLEEEKEFLIVENFNLTSKLVSKSTKTSFIDLNISLIDRSGKIHTPPPDFRV